MVSGQHHEGQQPATSLTIAVVGDVHDLWDEEDGLALKHLGVDLVLLVGDFGNESVEVVRSIAALDLPKAAIFGNHDAWYTATEWGQKKCPYDRQQEDRVQQQLDLLGAAHVGYGKLDLPELGLTVVGGRPFSWGGSSWKNEVFYQERYGISSFEASVDRIMAAVQQAAASTLIFIGHCGPTGLGDRAEDPCGRDWRPLGGDYGDPDLATAIAKTQSLGKSVPLVAFGHMHHQLRHTKEHLRKSLHSSEGTVYLNAARVPRIINTETDAPAGKIHQRLRNFSLVTLTAGVVTRAALVWIDQDFVVRSEQILYQYPSSVVQLASG
jgi:uncharacterized protein (TIGR04168 family)